MDGITRTLQRISPPWFRWFHQSFKFYLTVILHISLIVIHSVLLAYEYKHKHGSQVDSDSNPDFAGILFDYASKGVKYAVKGYAPLLTWLTQDLALRRNLNGSPTLSSLHDQSAAWLGLFPSIKAAYAQVTGARTAPWKILFIVGYFSALFCLGYTSSNYFDIGLRVNNTLYNQTKDLAMMLNTNDIELAFPVVNIFPQIDSAINTFGLSDNVLYNTGQVGGPVDSVTNASGLAFEASCSSVTSARQTGTVDLGNDNPVYAFHVDNDIEDLQFLPTPGAINVVSAARVGGLSSSTVFIAIVPPVYVEDLNASFTFAPISPSIVDLNCMMNRTGNCTIAISRIPIIGCSITATNVTALIDVNGQLVDVSPEVWDIEVNALANWTLQAAVPDFLAPVGELAVLSPLSARFNTRTVGFSGANVTSTRRVSLIEDILWNALFGPLSPDDATGLDISWLEDTLQRIVTLLYWRASIQKASENVDTSSLVLIADIQFRRNWAWAGLSLSIVALITSFALTVQRPDKGPEHYQLSRISGSGILQVTWLLSHPQVAHKALPPMGQIVLPDLKQLRTTGAGIELPFRDLLEKAALEKGLETPAAFEYYATKLA